MTKKDYELIAQAVKEITKDDYAQDRKDKAELFAEALEVTNEHFNREMFLKACGVSNA